MQNPENKMFYAQRLYRRTLYAKGEKLDVGLAKVSGYADSCASIQLNFFCSVLE